MRTVLVVALAALTMPSRAQLLGLPYDGGYEWIVPGQAYVALRIDTSAMYRVWGSQVTAAAPELLGTPVARLQLFFRGREVPMSVSDQGSLPGVWDEGDYLEFLAQRNDGALDSVLYKTPDALGALDPARATSPFRSLFTDRSSYFLTAGVGSGLRYADVVTASIPTGAPEPQFRHRAITQLTRYNIGAFATNDFFYSQNGDYTSGEGFTSDGGASTQAVEHLPQEQGFSNNNTGFVGADDFRFRVATPHRADSPTTPPVATIRYFSARSSARVLTIRSGSASTPPQSISSINVFQQQLTLNHTELGANLTDVTLNPTRGSGNNFLTLSKWVTLEYDRKFQFRRLKTLASAVEDTVPVRFFELYRWQPQAGAGTAYLRFEGLDFRQTGADTGYVYDLDRNLRVRGIVRLAPGTGPGQPFYLDTLHVAFPATAGNHRLVVATTGGARRVLTVERATLPALFSPDSAAEYVVICRRPLRATAEQFAAYHTQESPWPKNRARVVLAEDLYDVFTYGHITPLAIKKFVATITARWGSPAPRYLMLLGDGTNVVRTALANPVFSPIYLPPWGSPASDWEYVSNFSTASRSRSPVMAIGRVSVQTEAEALAYLAKLREHEQAPFAEWFKQAVHLGGGDNLFEQNQINGYLTGMGNTYTGAPVGGNLFAYQKFSNAVTDETATFDLRNLFESGISLLTFFGHSSTNIFDVDLDPPSSYNNPGRYPIMIANGCFGGDFTAGRSFGESYIVEPSRGSMGYLAVSGQGVTNYMGDLMTRLYRRMFLDSAQRDHSFSEYVAQAVTEWYQLNPNDIQYHNHAQQLNFLGDPAVRLNIPRTLDFTLQPGDVQISPQPLTASLNSYTLTFTLINQGLLLADSVTVSIRQTTGAGQVIQHPYIRVPASATRSTHTVQLLRNGANISGRNEFTLSVDEMGEWAEQREDNNQATAQFTFSADVPFMRYPWASALINQDTLSLRAGLYEAQAGTVTYEFEIDTLPDFGTPVRSGAVVGTDVQAAWRVPFSLQPGRVYYWRCRLPQVAEPVWATSSFIYRPGAEVGWEQSAAAQLASGNLFRVVADSAANALRFEQRDFVLGGNYTRDFNKNLLLNGSRPHTQVFTENGTSGGHFIIYDPVSFSPKISSLAPAPYDFPAAVVPVSGTAHINTLAQIINDMAPGDHIFFVGVGTHNFNLHTATGAPLLAALQSIGMDVSPLVALGATSNTTRFIAIGTKGAAVGTATTLIYPTPLAETRNTPDRRVPVPFTEGSLAATSGSGSAWGQVQWQFAEGLPAGSDRTTADLFALKADGTDSLLRASLPPATPWDASGLSAGLYPQLQFRVSLRDSVKGTPAQITFLRVSQTPAPDLAWDPSRGLSFPSQALQSGQVDTLRIPAVNAAEVPTADSVWAELALLAQGGSRQQVGRVRVPPLAPGAAYTVRFPLITSTLNGTFTAEFTLNPAPGLAERYRYNNVFSADFTIKGDSVNPTIDVTVDGRYLADGDIVRPSPEIMVEVRDDNLFKPITDPAQLLVYLSDANETFIQPLPLPIEGNPDMEFIPATAENGRARLIFRPDSLEDGKEYLFQVEASDASGNRSSDRRYQVRFSVEDESQLSQVVNYPNPFSTNTRFVYTLTGAELPEVFQIHIYTVTGRLIKVIDLVEEGDAVVGRNYLTRYAWDGTDEYGDKLANGVYLYRVVLKMASGEKPKAIDNGINQYFSKGWGKMYILR